MDNNGARAVANRKVAEASNPGKMTIWGDGKQEVTATWTTRALKEVRIQRTRVASKLMYER